MCDECLSHSADMADRRIRGSGANQTVYRSPSGVDLGSRSVPVRKIHCRDSSFQTRSNVDRLTTAARRCRRSFPDALDGDAGDGGHPQHRRWRPPAEKSDLPANYPLSPCDASRHSDVTVTTHARDGWARPKLNWLALALSWPARRGLVRAAEAALCAPLERDRLIGRRPVYRRDRHVEEAQVDGELTAVVDAVAQREVPYGVTARTLNPQAAADRQSPRRCQR